ncbi:unnamed protein product, partial [Phaeothamnion confervicola]
EAGAAEFTRSFCGTEVYMAPEMLLRKEHNCAVDWWTLGLFAHELMAARHPFRPRRPAAAATTATLAGAATARGADAAASAADAGADGWVCDNGRPAALPTKQGSKRGKPKAADASGGGSARRRTVIESICKRPPSIEPCLSADAASLVSALLEKDPRRRLCCTRRGNCGCGGDGSNSGGSGDSSGGNGRSAARDAANAAAAASSGPNPPLSPQSATAASGGLAAIDRTYRPVSGPTEATRPPFGIGIDALRRHPFFALATTDWEALLARKVPPPYVPALSSVADTSAFEAAFTGEQATDSDDDAAHEPGGGAAARRAVGGSGG